MQTHPAPRRHRSLTRAHQAFQTERTPADRCGRLQGTLHAAWLDLWNNCLVHRRTCTDSCASGRPMYATMRPPPPSQQAAVGLRAGAAGTAAGRLGVAGGAPLDASASGPQSGSAVQPGAGPGRGPADAAGPGGVRASGGRPGQPPERVRGSRLVWEAVMGHMPRSNARRRRAAPGEPV